MGYVHIDYHVNDQIAWIELNRPKQGNALNLEMSEELMDAAYHITHDQNVRVVVLSATGKSFSFGGDLNSFLEKGNDRGQHLKQLTMVLNDFINQMHAMKKPIITGINGTAAGAGIGLAVLGDIVIAQENAKFTMAYTNVGLTPDGSISYYLPKLIGLKRALELTLTNRVLTAEEAHAWGLVTKVVTADDFESELKEMAEKLRQGPAEAIKKAKALLYDSYNQTLASQLFNESRDISEQMNHPEGSEGVVAFVEKRKPNFK